VQRCECQYAYCDDVDHKCNIYFASLLRASGDHGAVQVLEPLGFDDAVPHGVQVFGSIRSDDVGHPVTGGLSTSPL
jgi:hypothetical protein